MIEEINSEAKKLNRKRILLYLVVNFGLTWLFEILVIWPMATGTDLAVQTVAQQLITLVMFFPAISVLLTRLITKEGFRDGILLAPVLNFLTCFGEEWGWRGYLLPKLLKSMGLLPTLLVSGVIWGLWHAPITMLGHNYGLGYPGYPFTGILAMCLFCLVTGAIFSYLTIRTGSCLPAVLGHGALNGFASAALLFNNGVEYNAFVGPIPTGFLGGCAFIICAVVMVALLLRNKDRLI